MLLAPRPFFCILRITMAPPKARFARNFIKAEKLVLRDIPLSKNLLASLSAEEIAKLREFAICNNRRDRFEEIEQFLHPRAKSKTALKTVRAAGPIGLRVHHRNQVQPMKEKTIKSVWVQIFQGGAPGLVQQRRR